MARRSPEEKLAEQMAQALTSHWFNPALFADIITTDNPVYTQDKLMDLIKWVIKYADRRFEYEWEHGGTSEGLLLANALVDTINQLENPK